MALATATVTFDISDKVGADFDARRTKGHVTTNVETVHDTVGHATRIGSGNFTINADGTGTVTVWVPGAGSNPASWQTTLHFDIPDRNAPTGRRKLSYGPFTITASAFLDELVEEQTVPPEYLTTVTQQLDAHAAGLEAGLDSAVAGIDTDVEAADAARVGAETAAAAAEAAKNEALAHIEPLTAPANGQVASFVTNDGPTKDALFASYVRKGEGGSIAALPLRVPTYDNNPSITHLDVLHVPGKFNGYEYWMAFTPFPTDPRENPSIVASHDGINWEVPAGLTNPVASYADATGAGYAYWSDPDLVLSPDGTTLMLYFRGTVGTSTRSDVLLVTSTNGVTWSARQVVLSQPGLQLHSPAVVVEDDDTFTMYVAQPMERMTSTDGINWSAPQACTVPAVGAPYAGPVNHLDVVKVGGTYHALAMLPAGGAPIDFRLFHWISTNGLTFTGSPLPAVPLSGTRFDARGNYRSTLQPAASGEAGKFDVWLSCIDNSRTIRTEAVWRAGYIGNYDFADGDVWAFPPPVSALPAREQADERRIAAQDFTTLSGVPVAGGVQDWPTFGLSHTAAAKAGVCWAPLPEDWHWYVVEALVVRAGSLVGDAVLSGRIHTASSGDALTITGGFFQVVVTPGAQNVPVWATLSSASGIAGVTPPKMLRATLDRSFSHASDTLDETLHILALRARRIDRTT